MMSNELEAKILQWKKRLKADMLTPRTVNFYAETVHAVAQILEKNGRSAMPKDITPQDVAWLLEYLTKENYSVQTRKGYISALRRWCIDGGNPSTELWPKIRWPADSRPNVTWLNAEQVTALLSAEMTPIQEIAVNLELREGFRHVEVCRLMAEDIDLKRHIVTIRGKGPLGGKPRLIPLVPQAEEAIRHWAKIRNEWVEISKKRFPATFQNPEQFVVWFKAGRLHPYSEEGYGLDKVVTIPLSKQLGFSVSNHALRRTFGRALYRSGVEVATIAKILGHESTTVTLRYIGVDMDDMRAAMQKDIFGGS